MGVMARGRFTTFAGVAPHCWARSQSEASPAAGAPRNLGVVRAPACPPSLRLCARSIRNFLQRPPPPSLRLQLHCPAFEPPVAGRCTVSNSPTNRESFSRSHCLVASFRNFTSNRSCPARQRALLDSALLYISLTQPPSARKPEVYTITMSDNQVQPAEAAPAVTEPTAEQTASAPVEKPAEATTEAPAEAATEAVTETTTEANNDVKEAAESKKDESTLTHSIAVARANSQPQLLRTPRTTRGTTGALASTRSSRRSRPMPARSLAILNRSGSRHVDRRFAMHLKFPNCQPGRVLLL